MNAVAEIKTVSFELISAEGSGLLMHNPAGMVRSSGKELGRKSIPTPEDEAEMAAYRLPSGQLYINATMVRGSILYAASGMKIGKKAANVIFSAALFPLTEVLPLYDPEDGAPIRKYEIDVRRAVVQKQGIMRARPLVYPWATRIDFQYDSELLSEENVLTVLTLAGRISGIGDYRPSKKGPFGRFLVQPHSK